MKCRILVYQLNIQAQFYNGICRARLLSTQVDSERHALGTVKIRIMNIWGQKKTCYKFIKIIISNPVKAIIVKPHQQSRSFHLP